VCLKQTGIPIEKLIQLGAIYVKNSKDFKPRRIFTDIDLVVGDHIRIHPYPRRYKIQNIDWKSTIVETNNDYIVINKPSGIPTNPMVHTNLCIYIYMYIYIYIYIYIHIYI
jgi:23S rRNA-/tRNA-specific pseudouridylate synthase